MKKSTLEAILITSFLLVVFFLIAFKINEEKKKKHAITHGTTRR